MMYHALSGVGRVGDCQPSGVDEFGDLCLYVPPGAVTPGTFIDLPSGDVVDSRTGQIISGPVLGTNTPILPTSTTGGYTPTGTPQTGFSWGSFFQSIFPSIAADATKIGQQALATPGTVILPNGTVAVGTSTGQAVSGIPGLPAMIGGISTGTVLLIGGGLLALVMVMKKR